MRFKINFELQDIDKIIPWGENQDSMHWFALTDGLLWINVGDDIIYEYSDEALAYWNNEGSRYNDYQLARFCEDFSRTFGFIYESVPKYLYDNIDQFETVSSEWEDKWDNEHPDDSCTWDEYFECLEKFTQWYQDRSFDSGHLIGGPYIGFFRYDDKIKILWDGRGKLDSGANIWTSPYGCYEMNYSDFIAEVRHFFDNFLMKMDIQVENALNKDWGTVILDKSRLKEEHQLRKVIFNEHLSKLLQDDTQGTDWESVKRLYNETLEYISKQPE